MDIRMPIMRADQATKCIVNAKTDLKKPIIIALTASVLEEEKTIFLEAGCDDFIRQPGNLEDNFSTFRS